MKKIIFLLALTLLLAGGAVAQKSKQSVQSFEAPIFVPVQIEKQFFYGIESCGGQMDVMNGVQRGNAFVFVSQDRNNRSSLTVSIDYVAVPDQPGVYMVTGGNWTLMVYGNGGYSGAIYGDIPEAQVTDTFNEETSAVITHDIKARFRILGGMENYADVQPEEKATVDFSSSTDYTNGKFTSAATSKIL